MVFNFYSDPGHGWLKVPLKLLKELKIEKEISFYSYYRKGQVYLEEDSDLSKFVEAMKIQRNWTLLEKNIRGFFTDRRSRIRNYELYKKEIA